MSKINDGIASFSVFFVLDGAFMSVVAVLGDSSGQFYETKCFTAKKHFVWVLSMSNPAARTLIEATNTSVELKAQEPCCIEVRPISFFRLEEERLASDQEHVGEDGFGVDENIAVNQRVGKSLGGGTVEGVSMYEGRSVLNEESKRVETDSLD